MKITSLMVKNPITITRDTSIQAAIQIMKTKGIRHLPVVSEDKKLLGLVTLADLREGLIPSMVSEVSLKDLIIHNPITVSPDDDIERAARRIYRHKISGMPVVRDGYLVGIITETDILRAFIDMMGILTATSRLEVASDETPEAFHRALRMIQSAGGEILSIGIQKQKKGKRRYHFRLTQCDTGPIQKALQENGFTVIDTLD